LLTALEMELLGGEAGARGGWRGACILVEPGGAVALLEEGGDAHRVFCSPGRLPLRAEALACAVVRGGEIGGLSLALFELNRALVSGGALILTARLDDPSLFLLKHGFALISERWAESGGPSVTLSRKAWRRYLVEACPRCGYRLVIPLIPPDANVRRVWTVYCPSCSYNWSVDEPVTEWV